MNDLQSPDARSVTTPDGTRLHVSVHSMGHARLPFLLVHGLASNSRLWGGVAEALAAAGHSSVAVDQRGHGKSDKVTAGFDFESLVDDLAAVIAATVPAPVIAVGQSWGGNVVLELAAQRPELVAGVACVDGGFIKLADTVGDWGTTSQRLAPPPLDGMLLRDLEEGMRKWLPGFPPEGIAAQLANYEHRSDGTVRPHLARDSHMTILRFLWEHDPDQLSERIQQPVLVIAASGGVSAETSRADEFAAGLQTGSVVWMDAHHDVHAQRPGDVADLLLEFAASLQGGSPG